MYLYSSYEHLKDYLGDEKEKIPFIGLRYTCFFLILICYGQIAFRVINVFSKDTMLRYRRLGVMSVFVIVLSILCK